MHTVNHAAVGAIIALTLSPVIALPLAFFSHFALDALPHYGITGDEGYKVLFKHVRTYVMVTFDLLGMAALILLTALSPWYVFLAMILAVSPDFTWIVRYAVFERWGKKPPTGLITRFHQKIQWRERLWGLYIEIPLAGALLLVVGKLV